MAVIILIIFWILLGFNICLEYIEAFQKLNILSRFFIFLLIIIFAPVFLIYGILETILTIFLGEDFDKDEPPDGYY